MPTLTELRGLHQQSTRDCHLRGQQRCMKGTSCGWLSKYERCGLWLAYQNSQKSKKEWRNGGPSAPSFPLFKLITTVTRGKNESEKTTCSASREYAPSRSTVQNPSPTCFSSILGVGGGAVPWRSRDAASAEAHLPLCAALNISDGGQKYVWIINVWISILLHRIFKRII